MHEGKLLARGRANSSPGYGMYPARIVFLAPVISHFRMDMYGKRDVVVSLFIKCAFGIPSAARSHAIENFIRVSRRRRGEGGEREREREREIVKKHTQSARAAYRCRILNMNWDKHESSLSRDDYALDMYIYRN